ncbi:MAG: hypothetical protein DMF14_14045 [Verrucomicrobia bacterium]|nr:MAG: hypothetical protein DMF14_14045 [Verrucomicrobiota bacterium]
MHSLAAKVKNESPILDDRGESEKVTSRARLSIAELLRKPLDVLSIALSGYSCSRFFTRCILCDRCCCQSSSQSF